MQLASSANLVTSGLKEKKNSSSFFIRVCFQKVIFLFPLFPVDTGPFVVVGTKRAQQRIKAGELVNCC